MQDSVGYADFSEFHKIIQKTFFSKIPPSGDQNPSSDQNYPQSTPLEGLKLGSPELFWKFGDYDLNQSQKYYGNIKIGLRFKN